MQDDLDDTASNPMNEDHLPAAGESETGKGLMGADIADDMHVAEPDDMTDISAHGTDRIDTSIPDPDGPAHPSATD